MNSAQCAKALSSTSHVLVHEIGHHLGFSDEHMEGIEAAAER
jgi:predicted Zn-dependent protease with MMP-like domain